jgi:hypothetical protein
VAFIVMCIIALRNVYNRRLSPNSLLLFCFCFVFAGGHLFFPPLRGDLFKKRETRPAYLISIVG